MVELTNPETERRVAVFGEVLFDRFQDSSEVLGGAPFNVAWNLEAFGVRPLLLSRIGDDSLGARILSAMEGWGMDAGYVQIDHERPTGIVEVRLADGEPTFDIIADCAYDFIDAVSLPELGERDIIYHGSLSCRSRASRAALASLLRRELRSVFFDVNLRPPWWEEQLVHELLATADRVKMNEDELERLAGDESGFDEPARSLLSRYDLEQLHLTRGARGAISFAARGGRYEVRPGSETEVVDTVGAGDAFSSVLILGRIRDWPLEWTLERAQEFAGAVVGLRGATTTERGFYERFTRSWNL